LEAGLLSTPTAYVETEVHSGSRPALWMQKLKLNIEEPITAILTLNTIAHTVGAAGAGAQATGVFGSEWFGLISAVLTFLILAFSEIIPKTLGTLYWKQLFVFNAYCIRTMVFALYPAVLAFKMMTNLLTPDEKLPTISRNEIAMMARIGTDEGTLKENENRILRNLLNLEAIQISKIMTPRTVVMSLQQDMTVGEVVKEYQVLHYSRIPIYDKDKDAITGFVLRLDIL
jgi:CBS domain containing-hemolysin-like protein